jgi:hypothetical protein
MSSLELPLKGTPAPRGAVSRTEASSEFRSLDGPANEKLSSIRFETVIYVTSPPWHAMPSSVLTCCHLSLPVEFTLDALEALWYEIDAPTRDTLPGQLGQLVHYRDQGRDNLIRGELGMIQENLSRAQTVFVTPFMKILRDGTIETLREMKALADDMLKNKVENMDERDAERERVINVPNAPPSDGDTSMGNASNDMSYTLESDSDKSTRSSGESSRGGDSDS